MERNNTPKRFLVVSLRYFGDALLVVTPMVNSIKKIHPDSVVDVLVFRGIEAILEGVEGIDHLYTVDPKENKWTQIKNLLSRKNYYDVAFSQQNGTRPFLYAWFWAKRQIIVMEGNNNRRNFWKRFLTSDPCVAKEGPVFLVNQVLLSKINIPLEQKIQAPKTAQSELTVSDCGLQQNRYVIIHPCARYTYKNWTVQNWVKIAQYLADKEFTVAFTGASADYEKRFIEQIKVNLPFSDKFQFLNGKLSFAQTADVCRYARLFIGVDTATTHVASATGVPTIALYGPTNTVVWGPWPSKEGAPYESCAPLQRRGNVWLVQEAKRTCQPCGKMGCETTIGDKETSLCLKELSVDRVIDAIDKVLEDKN